MRKTDKTDKTVEAQDIAATVKAAAETLLAHCTDKDVATIDIQGRTILITPPREAMKAEILPAYWGAWVKLGEHKHKTAAGVKVALSISRSVQPDEVAVADRIQAEWVAKRKAAGRSVPGASKAASKAADTDLSRFSF